jgi:hypothetical protein
LELATRGGLRRHVSSAVGKHLVSGWIATNSGMMFGATISSATQGDKMPKMVRGVATRSKKADTTSESPTPPSPEGGATTPGSGDPSAAIFKKLRCKRLAVRLEAIFLTRGTNINDPEPKRILRKAKELGCEDPTFEDNALIYGIDY